jgi:hypothetical protein
LLGVSGPRRPEMARLPIVADIADAVDAAAAPAG